MLFLVCFTTIIICYLFFRPVKFQCPKCKNIQKKCEIIGRETDTVMTNGRITKSGKTDKRYNTQFQQNEIISYGVDCTKCKTSYQLKSNVDYNFWIGTYTPSSCVKWEKSKKESEWLQRLRMKNDKLADAWKDYDDALANSMATQYEVLKSMGLDTSHIEEYMKKYGIKKGKSL
jgi:hypothetical protein